MHNRKKISFGLIGLTFYLLLFSACPLELSDKPGAKEYKEITKGKSSDNSKMISRFENYPIEKQIDIFLFSDDPRFGPILARGGQKNIESIVQKIENANTHMWDRCRLAEVLIRINSDCRCITSDSDVIRRLESVRASSSNPSDRKNDAYMTTYIDSVSSLKNQFISVSK